MVVNWKEACCEPRIPISSSVYCRDQYGSNNGLQKCKFVWAASFLEASDCCQHFALFKDFLVARCLYVPANRERACGELGRPCSNNCKCIRSQTPGGTAYANGQPSGALGVATSGPQYAQVGGTGTVYEWWYIDFDSGQDGWVAIVNCPAVPPSPPTLIYPGNGSSVPTIPTLTPTFSWNAVLGATGYGLYVQQGSTYPIDQDVGNTTSFTPSSGVLQPGLYYVWNMRAHDSAGYSAYSSGTSGVFYFQTPSCSFTLSPQYGANFDSSAASASVTVTTSSGCSWTASNGGASWITITSGGSGTGSGTVYYSITANTGTSGRSANMTIAGQNFSVAQSGQSCSFTLSPQYGANFDSSVASASVTVTTSSGCSWTASNGGASWITITSGGSGTGSGTVYYSITANTGTSGRSANMTIAGQNSQSLNRDNPVLSHFLRNTALISTVVSPVPV